MSSKTQWNPTFNMPIPGSDIGGNLRSTQITQRPGRANRASQDLSSSGLGGVQASLKGTRSKILSNLEPATVLNDPSLQDAVIFPNTDQITVNRHGVFIPQNRFGHNSVVEHSEKKLADGTIHITILAYPATPQKTNLRRAEPIDCALEMHWIAEHKHEYAGQWVALQGNQLLSHGDNAREVYEEARRLGIDNPFLVRLESAEQLPFGGW